MIQFVLISCSLLLLSVGTSFAKQDQRKPRPWPRGAYARFQVELMLNKHRVLSRKAPSLAKLVQNFEAAARAAAGFYEQHRNENYGALSVRPHPRLVLPLADDSGLIQHAFEIQPRQRIVLNGSKTASLVLKMDTDKTYIRNTQTGKAGQQIDGFEHMHYSIRHTAAGIDDDDYGSIATSFISRSQQFRSASQRKYFDNWQARFDRQVGELLSTLTKTWAAQHIAITTGVKAVTPNMLPYALETAVVAYLTSSRNPQTVAQLVATHLYQSGNVHLANIDKLPVTITQQPHPNGELLTAQWLYQPTPNELKTNTRARKVKAEAVYLHDKKTGKLFPIDFTLHTTEWKAHGPLPNL